MNWFNFLLQVNLYLVLFYAFYVALLRNETFFKLNRGYLLMTSFFSLLIPLCQVEKLKSLFLPEKIEAVAQVLVYTAEPIVLNVQKEAGYSWGDYLLAVYVGGVILLFVRLILKLLLLLRKVPEGVNAYSFFSKIVVSGELPGRDIILKHEKVHVREFHSVDTLWFEVLCILNWFNPVVYLFKKAMTHIHEYIADELAAEGEDKSEYAILLLSNVLGVEPEQLANSFFNESLLKNRIRMLQKTKSRKVAVLKYGLSLPLFIMMIAVSSVFVKAESIKALPASMNVEKMLAGVSGSERTLSDFPDEDNKVLPEQIQEKRSPQQTKNPIQTLALADTINKATLVRFDSLDVQPSYPGGMSKFYEYIGKNYKFPKEAKEKGIKGNVIMTFVVEADGSLTDIKVLRDLEYGTGDEGVRVLSQSVKWNPGIQNGKPVRVQYTLPIKVNIENSSKADLIIKGNGIEKAYVLLDGKQIDYRSLKDIDPKTIESIDVIKDKSRFAEFGAPSDAEGVVNIKSKK